MTLTEMKDYLNIPRDAAYALVKRDGFPARKLGKSWQIEEAALRKWIIGEIRRKGQA